MEASLTQATAAGQKRTRICSQIAVRGAEDARANTVSRSLVKVEILSTRIPAPRGRA